MRDSSARRSDAFERLIVRARLESDDRVRDDGRIGTDGRDTASALLEGLRETALLSFRRNGNDVLCEISERPKTQ